MQHFLLFLIFFIYIYTNPYSDKVYAQIKDIENPTYENYLLIEKYIKSGTIPHIQNMINWKGEALPRGLLMVKGSLDSIVTETIMIRSNASYRKKCIVIYTTLDEDNVAKAKALVKEIQNAKIKCHILYQAGGWPNLPEGDLVMAHIPGAYHLCKIREALRLGYQRVICLDCNVVNGLNYKSIFTTINKQEVFSYLLPYNFANVCFSREYVSAYNISIEMAVPTYELYAKVLGFDLRNKVNQKIMKEWYEITLHDEKKSFTPFGYQTLISYILNSYYRSSIFPKVANLK